MLDKRIVAAKTGHEAALITWKQDVEEKLAQQDPPEFFDLEELTAKSETKGIQFDVLVCFKVWK